MELLSIKDVQKMTTLNKQTIRVLLSKGDFVEPIRISPRRDVWVREEIEKWVIKKRKEQIKNKKILLKAKEDKVGE